jgi:predicted DNA-binding transcriptional regulator YafY
MAPRTETPKKRIVEKQERQTNLVLALLNTTTPLSLARIRKDVPGYDGGPDAVRQKFERDKRELRTTGIEILSIPIETDEQVGYRIEPASFWLPDLGLTDAEEHALGLAAATLGFGGAGVARVLLDAPPATPTAALATLPALPYLYRALAGQRAVSFTHKERERRVAIGTLVRHGTHWYAGGYDLEREVPRHFRVDRITGIPKLDAPGSGHLTAAQLETLRAARPWEGGRGRQEVTVRVDASIAGSVVSELEGDTTTSRHRDGSALVSIGWGLPGLSRSWVLGLLHHAVVVSPPRVRDDIVAWLDAIITAQHSNPGSIAWGPEADASTATPSAAQRLLAVLTTLAQQRRTTLTELSMRFGVSRDAMRTVLLEAACMGVPPFLHGDLLDIQVPLDDEEGDDVVWVDSGLFRPQLTWRDGFELAASARAALALTGADDRGALAGALEKLETVTGAKVDIDVPKPAALAPIESAVAGHRQLLVTYYSASSDAVSDRRIEPVAVRERAGRFYALAWCHLAGGWRTFRLDRIDSAVDVGTWTHTEIPPAFDDVYGFADAERVDIALTDDVAWLQETEGVERIGSLADGRTVIRLAVASPTYLARLMVQAGAGAEVIAPESLQDIGRDAAARVRERYGRRAKD